MRSLCVAFVLIAVLGFILAGRVTAQTFTTLRTFDDYYNDGANPSAGMNLSSNVLYGTAKHEGKSRAGIVFAINTDGTGFTNLHNFLGFPNEGGLPEGELILSDRFLYGTSGEGTSGFGTIFSVNVDDAAFTTLHTFSAFSDGSNPYGGLLLSSNVLYGTAGSGGSHSRGTVFRVGIDGTGFTNLHSFSEISISPTNSDGAHPYGGLVLFSNKLCGTTANGGEGGVGTVFALNTDGTGFVTLHSFSALSGLYPFLTNSDGANPQSTLILLGNTLYGTAQNGGISGNGTVFAVKADGTGFRTLHSFAEAIGSGPFYTNEDGIFPEAGLASSGSTLYGTAYGGGSSGNGTVFAINTNGTGFTTLHSFADIDGANPVAGLLLSNNTLYGTTAQGGSSGHGTLFSLSFRPQLSINRSAANVILMWPTNVAGFDYTGYTLQSTTNLVSPVWTTNSPAPVVVNGLNTVTNPISGTQQFFRLSQ